MKSISRWIWLLLIVCSLRPPHNNAQAQSGEQLWLFNQINNLRAQVGLHSYVWNPQLAAAAQQHSEYMAATGHISHQQSNGSMPSDRAAANGFGGSWVSENIYGGGMATASHAWNFWLNSSVHYAGMTNRNTNSIGIGVASGYYTLVFGYVSGVEAPPAQPVDNPPASEQDDETVDVAPVQAPPQAPPPTRAPPTLTFTPSPTVPTFTPTPTWTLTPTWTPSASPTPAPPTSTPISLPTAAVIVAAEPTEVVVAVPVMPTQVDSDPPRQRQVTISDDDEGFKINDLLPVFLAAQVILIGIGIYSLFFRSAKKT
jgi:hypothetical protein